MDNATFKEKVVFRLMPRQGIILLVSLVLLLILLTIALISFTPLREYIPGYGSGQNYKLTLLQAKTDSINKLIVEITNYGHDIQTVLTDGKFKNDSIDSNQKSGMSAGKSKFAFSEYDSILMQMERKKIDKPSKSISIYTKQKESKPPDLFFAPVNGSVLQKYNANLKGIKISAAKENSVFASLAGTVIYTDYNLKTGACILILHPSNVITVYQQAGKPCVEAGDYVKPKQAISTIDSDIPMTFKLWINGDFVNPEEYIVF